MDLELAINEIDFTARLANPSLKHPFGTDDLGQDLLHACSTAAASRSRGRRNADVDHGGA